MTGFWTNFLDALTLQAGWNAAVVCLGAAALGAGAGVVGVFSLLRGRAMMSDAISHATLPGVAAAFLIVSAVEGDSRALPLMLLGGAASAGLGVLAVQWISARTRLGEDVAIGTVLSSFFALGVALLTVIQQLALKGQAGVEQLLIGSAAGMLEGERETIMIVASILSVIAIALTREFAVVAFDPDYAASLGWPVRALDLALMGLLLAIVVVGLTHGRPGADHRLGDYAAGRRPVLDRSRAADGVDLRRAGRPWLLSSARRFRRAGRTCQPAR